jgi:hypothetical protein
MKRNVSSENIARYRFNNVFKTRLSNSKKLISNLCSIVLSVFFAYAGIYMLYYKHFFEWQLNDTVFLKNYTGVIVWIVPIFELIISLFLLVPRTRIVGFYLSFFLLLGILSIIFILQHFFERGPCVCIGIFPSLSWLQQNLITIGFIVISITGASLIPVNKKGSS